MTPTLVTETFGLGVGFDPPSRSSKTNITCRWCQSTALFIPILQTKKPIGYCIWLQEMKPLDD